MIKNFPHEPLVYDAIAHRELQGIRHSLGDENDLKNAENNLSLNDNEEYFARNCIERCYRVYENSVNIISSEEMWSLFIECMLEINQNAELLPNLKNKLLKASLTQAHESKKLKEKYYLYWVGYYKKYH